MAVEASLAHTLNVTETLADVALASNSNSVRHTGFSSTKTLNASSTPAATKVAAFAQALTAGAATIDFTALPGTNGATVDGTGLKVRAILLKNTGANPMTLTPGASNGLELFGAGSSLTIPPDCTWGPLYFKDAAPAIAGADKNIDIAGTGAQVLNVIVVLG